MKKISIMLLCVALVGAITIQAAAAGEIDPTIYATERETVGQSTYLTVNGKNELTGGATIIGGKTAYFTGTSKEVTAANFRLYWYPFGANSKCNIDTFKTGGTVIVRHLIKSKTGNFYGSSEFGIEFFNSSGTSLGARWYQSATAEYAEGIYQFVWQPPAGAATAYFIIRCNMASYSETSASDTFTLESCTIKYEMTTEAANNAAIGSIDEAINGSGGSPIEPSGSGAIDDIQQAEDNLMAGSEEAKEEINTFGENALAFFEQFTGVFAFISFLLGLILGAFPLWQVLLYVALSVGIFASVVNIVGNAARSTSDNAKQRQRQERNQGRRRRAR